MEKDIERKLKKEVERNGGICFKFLSSVSGVPDRLILLPGGRVFFVETKRRGEKPRPLQQRQIKKIRDLGFKVYVLDDEKEIGNLVAEANKEEIKAETKKKEVMPDEVRTAQLSEVCD